jgi:outer membrane protein TolC
VAQTLVRQAEDQLRLLILDPKRDDYWTARLDPADLVPPVAPSPDVDAAVRAALQQRTDLIRTRKQIENTQTAIALAKSEVLPDVRVQATYLTTGLGGTELTRQGGFPGIPVPIGATAFGDVLRQLFVANYPTWTVGLSVSYPLGKNADEATLARSELERQQSMVRLRSAEFHAVREIREAALLLDQNRQRIETTRVARELSEQRPDAEQKRYDVGMSTNFNVIQAQRDLAVARNNELLAQLDYQLALIAYETVQKIPASPGPNRAAPTSATDNANATGVSTSPLPSSSSNIPVTGLTSTPGVTGPGGS